METLTEDQSPPTSSALDIMRGRTEPGYAARQLLRHIQKIDPRRIPQADLGLLLCVLAATDPDTLSPEIANTFISTLEQADLRDVHQPGIDEIFRLAPLLVATPGAVELRGLAYRVLSTGDVHPRWARKAITLLQMIADWRPELLNLDDLLSVTETAPHDIGEEILRDTVEEFVLADPSEFSLEQYHRIQALAMSPVQSRYLLNAIASHSQTRDDVRRAAMTGIDDLFPLRTNWRRLTADRPLTILCIQNIADAQGDEIVRLNALLQAFLDERDDTQITLVTDRSYLWQHDRIRTLSFDDRKAIEHELNGKPEVLIEFFEPNIRYLNYDPDLHDLIENLRQLHQPVLDIFSSKGWNRFQLDSVRLQGVEWSHALELDRWRTESVYDSVTRFIAELGLPLRSGETWPMAEPALAIKPVTGVKPAWEEIEQNNVEQRPVALLNIFGGASELKGFARRQTDSAVRVLSTLADDGYFVVFCLTDTPWGSRDVAARLLARLPTKYLTHVILGPDPGEDLLSPRSEAMRQTISLLAQAALVVCVEGWMVHAAYALGKPVRVLMLPQSHSSEWLPWGRSSLQQRLVFTGATTEPGPPLPEQPRKFAWLQLLQRVDSADWLDVLLDVSESEDPDLRQEASQALGRTRAMEAFQPLVALLDDSSHNVRGAAADMLLTYFRAELNLDATTLKAYRLLAADEHGLEQVARLGAAALPALRAALHGDDPVTRRSAAIVIEWISRHSDNRETEIGAGSIPRRTWTQIASNVHDWSRR
jgi:ADP-heptose:LPS heptosyltransferase